MGVCAYDHNHLITSGPHPVELHVFYQCLLQRIPSTFTCFVFFTFSLTASMLVHVFNIHSLDQSLMGIANYIITEMPLTLKYFKALSMRFILIHKA